MLRAFEPMGLMVRGREPYESDKFLKNAVALETLGKQPWSYFTAGSYYSPTRAKPTVWQYPQEFKAKQKDFLDASVQLTHVSLSANLALIRPAYENVVHACNACHDQFRRSGFWCDLARNSDSSDTLEFINAVDTRARWDDGYQVSE
jgi:cytochrome c556